jgi:DNA-binding MarR family transcriptional regulator
MNSNFADTLYFKKENILEIILRFHRSYKSLQREIQTCCELNGLTFNELLVLLELQKKFEKKTEIANKIFIKKQNLNLIFKELEKKNIIEVKNKKALLTDQGKDLMDKTINRVNEKIIQLFQKTDPKNMSGFINIIETL